MCLALKKFLHPTIFVKKYSNLNTTILYRMFNANKNNSFYFLKLVLTKYYVYKSKI